MDVRGRVWLPLGSTSGHAVAEPVTAASPRPVRHPVMVQHWNDITWLHWAQDPDRVGLTAPY